MPVTLDVVGKTMAPLTYEYTDREVILYALGVGAGTDELPFVYEQAPLKVIPTFGVVPAFPALMGLNQLMTFNPMMLLHGEQRIVVKKPFPSKGKVTTTGSIKNIWDKGSGAVVVIDAETVDEKGDVLCLNTFGVFLRGEGGFGGERGPSGPRNVPPERAPDAVVEMATLPQQAAIYRLSGDRNPLHIDPNFAKMAGYDRPILHGLCSFGHVARAVIQKFCGGDSDKLKELEVRFAGPVFPGETLVVEMWRDSDTRVLLQVKTAQRGEVCLSSGAAVIAS